MVRPIVIATIGYLIGLIIGLYFKSMVPFYLFLLVAIMVINLLPKTKMHRYFRYIKIILNFKVIVLILVTSFIGFYNIIHKNNEYENMYNKLEQLNTVKVRGVVVSNKVEKKYKYAYEIQVNEINGKEVNNCKFYCYINKSKYIELEYGELVTIEGEYQKPEEERNKGEFNYALYLKTKDIYGVIKADKVTIEQKNKINPIMKKINDIQLKIKEDAKNIKGEEQQQIYLGLILGDKSNMDEQLQDDFRVAGMAHILAVSGMHISYLIIGSIFILKRIFGLRTANILTCIILIIYMMITGFSSSIARAGIMGIIVLLSNLVYRKNDTSTCIAMSLLIILIINPYLITNAGLQLSYAGTIGIILFRKTILDILQRIEIKNKKIKNTMPKYIKIAIEKTKEIIAVAISAQLLILPISIFHFNLFSSYFLVTNFLVSIIIGPVFIIGILYAILMFINVPIANMVCTILEIGLKLVTLISQIPKHLIGSKIYVPTPKIWQIVLYYIVIFIVMYIIKIKHKRKRNMSEERVLNLKALAKFRYMQMNKTKKKIIVVTIVLIIITIIFVPKPLKINFIDVGQGDSTFIITPTNKTILIDGGGAVNRDYDVGKNTLLPYILKRGYNKIDYVIISHFDQDHVGGIMTILEEIEVGQVIIAKQVKTSENYEKFLKLVQNKSINVKVVQMGDVIAIENNCYFKILWPNNEPIEENELNNNAIVAKFIYKDFSCLFTGDIEEAAEKKIVNLCREQLNSTILKVAHHGSKTSSTEEFLENVKPKIALIGVGKNNTFGHPNSEVLKRISKFTKSIYRTDLNGEICIKITKMPIITVNTIMEVKGNE